MDNFKCFQNDEPLPCEDICDDNIKIYYYQFGLIIIVIFFFVLIRPFVDYVLRKCFKRNNNNTIEIISNNQETQCDIDFGMQRIVINPDRSFNLSEIN